MFCSTDCENYVEIINNMQVSTGTEICIECNQLIHSGAEHYRVKLWTINEDGDDTHLAVYACCEECGDMAASLLESGCCWLFGDLRSDIRELKGL